MQLDAEEDESAMYKPPVEPTARKEASISEDSHDSEAAALLTAEEGDE